MRAATRKWMNRATAFRQLGQRFGERQAIVWAERFERRGKLVAAVVRVAR